MKTTVFQIRISEKDKEKWTKAAQDVNMSLAAWIHWRCNYNLAEATTDQAPEAANVITIPPQEKPVHSQDGRCERCIRIGLDGCKNCPKNLPEEKPAKETPDVSGMADGG